MLFKSRKKIPTLRLYHDNLLIYDGPLTNLPLRESVILEKSEEFFSDPEPCHIHRSAVRIRLTAEIQEELQQCQTDTPGPLLLAYADFEAITRYLLTSQNRQYG